MRKARNQLSQDDTPFGPILQYVEMFSKEGEDLERIALAHPHALLWKSVAECKPFRAFLKTRLLKEPCTQEEPWSLVVYSDEVTLGNPLATMNRRKFQSIYLTF